MYKLWSITAFRLKLLFKVKSVLIMLFVLPIIFSFIFGGISFSSNGEDETNPKVGVVVGKCEECESVRQYLERNVNYTWEVCDYEVAKQAVTSQEIVAAIIIPDNIFDRIYHNRAAFDVIVNNKTEDYLPLSYYIDGVANQLHMYTSTLKISNDEKALHHVVDYVNQVEPIKLEKSLFQSNEANKEQGTSLTMTISLGFTVMFMMFAISNSASSIHQERRYFSWQRLIISGTSPTVISLGTMLAYFLVGWMQFATVILFMKLVYNVNWGPLSYLMMFGSLMILTVVSFSMLIVTLVNSKVKADTLSAIVVVSTCMLGGVYWPISIMPYYMQIIGMFTPQYWMMKGLHYGLMSQTSLAVTWLPITILIMVIILFTYIVIHSLSREKANESL